MRPIFVRLLYLINQFGVNALVFLLFFVLSAFIARGLYWIKPFLIVDNNVAGKFTVLIETGTEIHTAKYQSEERCSEIYIKPRNLPPKNNIQIGSSESFYSVSKLPDGTSSVLLTNGSIEYYEYIITSECVIPLRRKVFSSWEIPISLILSSIVVVGINKYFGRRK